MAISSKWFAIKKNNLPPKKTHTPTQTEREEIAILLIFLHAHGRFLQLVDVRINLLERSGVRRPEKFSVCNFGDFSQTGLVKRDRRHLIEDVTFVVRGRPAIPRILQREWRNPICPNSDGVKVDMQRLERLRRRIRRNFTGIIIPIG